MTVTIAASVPVDAAARAKDERDLSILRRACGGERYSDINRATGNGGSFAQVIVARVRDADIRESGEAMSAVLAHYPIPRSGRAVA